MSNLTSSPLFRIDEFPDLYVKTTNPTVAVIVATPQLREINPSRASVQEKVHPNLNNRHSLMALANNYDNLSAGAQSAIGKRTQLFINGEFRNPLSGQYFPIVDPSNGLELAEVAQADKQDAD